VAGRYQGLPEITSSVPIGNHIPSITGGLFPFARQPWVDIPRPAALRNVAGHVAEGTNLLAGRAMLWWGLDLEGMFAVGTFPMGH